jgi:splicing factor U2AF 35 kDa subunit
MASALAAIYGTEADKVNCSFYYKIGACRHGDRCSRKHVRPNYSQTILCGNIYHNPQHIPGNTLSASQTQQHFDAFYEDFYSELCRYGELEEMHVCDNVGDHLIGNVYARFKYEEDAQRALDALNSRWYAARPVYAELSPVTDFREACCRQHSEGNCGRGGFCNFMHVKKPNPVLLKELQLSQRAYQQKKKAEEGREDTPERSPSPPVTRRWY